MGKSLFRSASTFARNVATHGKRLLLRQETLDDVVESVSKDTDKLKRAVKNAKSEGRYLEATRLTEKGRRAYNEKNFAKAEEYFRQAIVSDATYPLAYTYLGSALYKQEKVRDATQYWLQAIKLAPGSDAAARAEKHLHAIKLKKEEVIAELEDRFKK
ncbi:MAG: tetratricopeptide repeat protein [Candidatus Hydrogenedentes bacterium]|nr:tetratricopeptide repeat protein [Candidatus Hydrogenedentota bacterium]